MCYTVCIFQNGKETDMLQHILSLLNSRQITLCGCIPLSSCRIQKPYLLQQISSGSVVIFAIPYYTAACDNKRNLSAYAVAKDYHLFVQNLAEDLKTELQKAYPNSKFALFADHSPIDERDAAARAGLGVIGKNGLLITKPFSSYVFLAELITDAILPYREQEIETCENCGVCASACPYRQGECRECLSALTQRKGDLSETEVSLLCRYGTVWGCDICSEACPHTMQAKASGSIYSPIPFFEQDTLSYLTSDALAVMSEKDFSSRAYSWRGRETIKRNLYATETAHGTTV